MDCSSEILEQVKTLLGTNDKQKDDILLLLINDAVSAVLAYCRLEELPGALYGVIAQMCVKSFRAGGYGSEEAPREIKSIQEGDTSISFESKDANGFLNTYKSRLAPFVRKWAHVPSEVARGDEDDGR